MPADLIYTEWQPLQAKSEHVIDSTWHIIGIVRISSTYREE